MDIHYNAFISYRHSPVDSKVAAEIQRQLEHFHIPGAIRERTGVKRINRIFRDKEELPITSDLNGDITRALEHADYLIVICSPRTEESAWVRREIETFLRTHSRRQVLTVLAEGEPEDTIPDLLRYDDSVDLETGEVHRVPVEPLSCDYRGSIRIARREELPRLAASLLGCGYDELRQRQRQYKARRLTAILAGVLCLSLAFLAYFFRTSMVIRDSYRQLSESNQLLEESYQQVEENYEQALRNQSEYLTAESLSALEEGDRLLAIQLALEALPSEGDDRPALPRAEYALSQAVGAYQTEEEIMATGSFTVEGTVKDYILNEDGSRLIVADSLNLVTVWDTDTYRQVMKLRPKVGSFDLLFLLRDRYLVVQGGYGIQCFDLENGSEVWFYEERYICDIAVAAEDTRILATGYDEKLTLLDAMTGEVLSVLSIREEVEIQWVSTCYNKRDTVQSADGSLVALVGTVSVYDMDGTYLGNTECPVVLDLEQGEASCLPVGFYVISDMCFSSENELIVMGKWGSEDVNYASWSFVESKTTVCCISLETGTRQWTNEIPRYRTDGIEKIVPLEDGAGVVCVTGNVCAHLDSATGELLGRGEAPDCIIGAYPVKESGNIAVTSVGGNYGYFDPEENICYMLKYFVDSLADFRQRNGAYLQQSGSQQILQYRNLRDENFQEIDGYTADGALYCASNEDYHAVVSDGNICVLDYAARSLVFRMDLRELENYYRNTLLGLSRENMLYIYYECREEGDDRTITSYLMSVDVAAGTYTTQPYDYDGMYGGWKLAGDVLYYPVRSWTETDCLVGYRIGEGEIFRAALPPQEDYTEYELCVSPGGSRALVKTDGRGTFLYDLSDGSYATLKETVDYNRPTGWSEDESLFTAADAETVYIWRADGSLVTEIPFEGGRIQELQFMPQNDMLLILADGGELYRYGLDGEYLGETAIHFSGPGERQEWRYLEDGSLLILRNRVLNVIDTQLWAETLYVNDCHGYDSESGTIICSYYDNEDSSYHFGYYQRYSMEDLIAMGRDYVAAVELTAERKAAYGLD